MPEIAFHLNGTPVRLPLGDPSRTLLDWLREDRGLTGTKEGCNEGDCGACTVIVTDEGGARALNACILFLPQLHGRAVTTVEGIAAPDGTLHPVQAAMVEHHGSQCGFCTPGFIASMAAGHLNGRHDHDDLLAGNLCRCTGYAPILRAAEAAAAEPVPDWIRAEPPADPGPAPLAPDSADALAAALLEAPEALIVGGATDVGLWVTKELKRPGQMIFLHACRDLQDIEETATGFRVGAGVTVARLRAAVEGSLPALAEYLRRFASEQIRAAATMGGNIANGSPIGDLPPALIALGATLTLRRGAALRTIPLQDFFLDYRKQDRAAGEFVHSVEFRKTNGNFRAYKISKRFDQDISAVSCGFDMMLDEGRATGVRLAFGGMAGIPKRARAAETALEGQPFAEPAIRAAMAALATDFQPLSDMRASAGYRLEVAQNLLLRWYHDVSGAQVSVLELGA
ncbi:FAD binding domain-containing protein [Frigidibacter sp. MR17.14]|uniref:xanthine dehydrogenase small subunit n=1 Tax=Frigidibacter sp. MR17.14 TaxID=3126509 RepID=UPI003012DA5D